MVQYYVIENGASVGPIESDELRRRLSATRNPNPDLKVCAVGSSQWVPVSSLMEFVDIFPTARIPPPPPIAGGMFCKACGNGIDVRAEICPKCGVRQRSQGKKDRTIAALLAFFLGGFGIHKFYLGQPLLGVLYLLFVWTFIPSIISFIEFLLLIFGSEQRFNERYNS